MQAVLLMLAGGDRRSIGRSEEVVKEVLADVSLFLALFHGMVSPDAVVRMRAADAVEKVTSSPPDLLHPFKEGLLGEVAFIEQQEVRWYVAQMQPWQHLTDQERAQAMALLQEYLEEKSRNVQTFALQAMADLAQQNASVLPPVVESLEATIAIGGPAVRSRYHGSLAQARG